MQKMLQILLSQRHAFSKWLMALCFLCPTVNADDFSNIEAIIDTAQWSSYKKLGFDTILKVVDSVDTIRIQLSGHLAGEYFFHYPVMGGNMIDEMSYLSSRERGIYRTVWGGNYDPNLFYFVRKDCDGYYIVEGHKELVKIQYDSLDISRNIVTNTIEYEKYSEQEYTRINWTNETHFGKGGSWNSWKSTKMFTR